MATQPAPVALAHEVVGSGPAVVLLPGTGYAGTTWPAAMIDALAGSHTVIAPDYRGTGRTPGTDDAYSTRLFALDVLALLERLGIREADVLGHSMGGRVAQWVALEDPGRVRSLVLAASGAGAGSAPGAQPAGIPLEACITLIEAGYEGYMRRQITRTFFTAEFAEQRPDVVDGLVGAFWAARPPLRDYLKHVIARQEHSTLDRLGEMRMPAFVIVGDRDTHAGGTGSHLEQSRFLAQQLPAAELRLVPGAAHGYFWQCPELSIPPILEFLARVGRD